jgi:hypothetical protein
MPNAHVSFQAKHVALEKNVRNQAVGLSKSEMSFGVGENSSCILATVLKDREAVIEQLIHVGAVLPNNAEDAAHEFASCQPIRGCFLSLR